MVYGGGMFAAFIFYQLIRNFIGFYGYGELQRGLRAKIERQDFSTNDWNGCFVGFAPASQPRIYEKFYIWDTGFLFLTAEQLSYVGEETRFALRREHVVDVYLGDGTPDWIRRNNLYIKWRDESRGAGGTFHISPGGARSLWQFRRKVRALHRQIQTWVEQQSTFPATPERLAELPTPSHGSVTSIEPRTVFNLRTFIKSLFMIVMFTFALGVAFNLQRASILYAVATCVLICFLERVPRLLHRGPADDSQAVEDTHRPLNYQPEVLVETET
jgi:hypothetical protein